MNGTTFGLGIPPTILLWIALAIIVIIALRYSAYGRYIYALGGNRRSAKLIGISEFKYWTLAYAISGTFAALTGSLLLGWSGGGFIGVGDQYLFTTLAAVVIGGTSLMGGYGGYGFTVIGVLVLQVLSSFLIGIGLKYEWQQFIFGLLILPMVALYGRATTSGLKSRDRPMFGTLFQSSDLVSTSYGVATVATLASAALVLLRALLRVRSLAASRCSVGRGAAGLGAPLSGFPPNLDGDATDDRRAALCRWFVVQPMQVAAVYFLARIVGPVPAGGLLADGRRGDPDGAVALSGRCAYFQPDAGRPAVDGLLALHTGRDVFRRHGRRGPQCNPPDPARLFLDPPDPDHGWAIYPILHFVDVVIGAGHARPIIVLYTLADLVNLVTVSMIVLAVGGRERF